MEINTEAKGYSGFFYDEQLRDPLTRISLHPNSSIIEYQQEKFDNPNQKPGDNDWKTTSSPIPHWEPIGFKRNLEMGEVEEIKNEKGETVKTKSWNGGFKVGEITDGTPLVSPPDHYSGKSRVLMTFTPEDEEDRYQIAPGVPVNREGDGFLQYPYSKEPICSSILNEEFKVSISNTYSEFGGDPLSGILDSFKASLPITKEMGKFVTELLSKTESYKKNKEKGTEGAGYKSGILDKVEGALKYFGASNRWMSTIASRKLVTQGTRFSYFNGTGISFDNVTMSFTIFPTWEYSERDRRSRFITVYDQIDRIMPYVVGDYVPLDFGGFANTEGKDSKIVAIGKDAANTFSKVLSEFASWQLPPGGFEVNIKDIDIVQFGTLKLRVGSLYAVDNLVISGCNFSMSKQLVKNPEIDITQDSSVDNLSSDELAKKYLTPAYCDVNLALKPISKFSKNSLLRFLYGYGNLTDRKSVYGEMRRKLGDTRDHTKTAIGELLSSGLNESIFSMIDKLWGK